MDNIKKKPTDPDFKVLGSKALAQNIAEYEAQFIQIILNRLGIKMSAHNKDLQSLLIKICETFNFEARAYLDHLQSCPDNSPALEYLVEGITIGETYFFRDKLQMEFLQNILLPKLIKKKRASGHLSLRIWSAGCASGEEIYTIAMMLNELLPDIHRWKLHLLGTDINTQFLKKARLGQYNKWSLRSIPEPYKHRYLTESHNQYVLSSPIRNMVTFNYFNLKDTVYPSLIHGIHSQDIIFCRNVLIYFTREIVTQVMKQITQSLALGGHLILGASDPIVIENLGLVYHGAYGIVFSRQSNPADALLSTCPKASALPAVPCQKVLKTPASLQPTLPNDASKNTFQTIGLSPAQVLSTRAREAANLGQLTRAIQLCKESLAIDSTHKDTFFTYGLILIESNQTVEAELMLKKALFLDRKFIEAHFQLGLLQLKSKRYKEGLKSLHNALSIINLHNPTADVPNSPGLNYGRFADILNTEIARYQQAGNTP